MEGYLEAKCGHRVKAAKGEDWKVELTCVIIGCKECPYENGTEYYKEDHVKADLIVHDHREEFGLLGNKQNKLTRNNR